MNLERNPAKKNGISLTIGFWNPSSTDEKFNIQYLESWNLVPESRIHSVESRIGLGGLGAYHRFCCRCCCFHLEIFDHDPRSGLETEFLRI